MFTRLDMSDCTLSFSVICGTSTAITPIPYKTRHNRAFPNPANSNG
jgi:hypothetical protein